MRQARLGQEGLRARHIAVIPTTRLDRLHIEVKRIDRIPGNFADRQLCATKHGRTDGSVRALLREHQPEGN